MRQIDLVARAISAKANRRIGLNSGDMTVINEEISAIIDSIDTLTMRVVELENDVKNLSETEAIGKD